MDKDGKKGKYIFFIIFSIFKLFISEVLFKINLLSILSRINFEYKIIRNNLSSDISNFSFSIKIFILSALSYEKDITEF